MSGSIVDSSSFRDPCGFIFTRDGLFLRQINKSYKKDYDLLISSGLYRSLVEADLLISHRETDDLPAEPKTAYKIIRPLPIPFISYAYEWSFSQLKDAALVTLEIQKRAIDHGMSLKDAPAFNIQFLNGKPLLIDTLSFESYSEGKPWIAYRQFCQHFLAPLTLMATKDIRLGQLLKNNLDGIPLDLASTLLPRSSRFRFGTLTHIHMHAKSQKKYQDRPADTPTGKVSKQAMLGLIDSLESTVKKLIWQPEATEWGEYYDDTNYSRDSFEHKNKIVAKYIEQIKPSALWDLGANTGIFSRIASERNIPTVAFDIDPAAVEKNYLQIKEASETNLLPLLVDLSNPTPSLGWENRERMSLSDRGPVDTIMALALIHHLAISNNLPLERIASFFGSVCHWLIIEFVPKSDSQVQRLLSSREDIFDRYTQTDFERTFEILFTLERSDPVKQSERRMYLMRKTS